ncbi:MAG: hypothetical protein IPP29_17085 [Bacteroidetes bacterium]|nr:hypothetical protein [Bacteroidota bacterium]
MKEKDLILGMMPSRERDLNYAFTGLQQTHTSLVGIDDKGSPVFWGHLMILAFTICFQNWHHCFNAMLFYSLK